MLLCISEEESLSIFFFSFYLYNLLLLKVGKYIYTYVNIFINTLYICVYVNISIFINIHMCVYVCIYIYIYIYIHSSPYPNKIHILCNLKGKQAWAYAFGYRNELCSLVFSYKIKSATPCSASRSLMGRKGLWTHQVIHIVMMFYLW